MDRSHHLVLLLEESRISVHSLPLSVFLSLLHMCLPSSPYTLSFIFLHLLQCFSLSIFWKLHTSSAAWTIIQYEFEYVHEGLSQSPSLDLSAYTDNPLLFMPHPLMHIKHSLIAYSLGGCPIVLLCVHCDLGVFQSAEDEFITCSAWCVNTKALYQQQWLLNGVW